MTVGYNSLPALMSGRLGLECKELSSYQGFRMYIMDLSRHLSFIGMDDIRYIEFPDERMSDEEGFLAFHELVAKFRWHLHIKLALVNFDSQGLKQRLSALGNVIVISRADLQRVAESKNVTQPLRDLFRAQMSLDKLVGYQYHGAVTGNRFFGRESQLAALIQRPDISYLVTGTRMSGKTSLLLEAKRRLTDIYPDSGGSRPNKIYIDCKRYSTFAGLINAILTETEDRSSFSNIERWESPHRWHHFYSYLRQFVKDQPGKRLYLFLDEYDQVLNNEANGDLKITWNFRALHQDNSDEKGKGIIQFVFAGSKDLVEKAARLDSALYNFVNVDGCRLHNFDLGTINLILRKPMEDLGFKIDDPMLISQEVLHESAGRPSSVQFICYHLVQRLLMTKKENITIADLREVVQSPQYMQYYDTTLHENTDALQRFILSSQSKGSELHATFSREDILAGLKKSGVYLDSAKLIHSLNDLVNSGFLVFDERSRGGLRYVLSAPVIKRIFKHSAPEAYVNLMVKQGSVFRLNGGGHQR